MAEHQGSELGAVSRGRKADQGAGRLLPETEDRSLFCTSLQEAIVRWMRCPRLLPSRRRRSQSDLGVRRAKNIQYLESDSTAISKSIHSNSIFVSAKSLHIFS